METLQPLIDLLSAKFGWTPAAIAWIGALRLIVKPFNARLQTVLTAKLAETREDPEAAAWWHDKVLTRPWYRVAAFFGDLVLSLKLPSHADFNKLINPPKE